MKALLYKDFRMCWKLVAVYYVFAIGFAVLAKSMTGLFYQIWPMVMLGIVPVNIMAYEEQAGWNILAQSLPISRKMQVAEKYVLSVLLAVVVGTPLGLLAGYFRGACEAIVMRLADGSKIVNFTKVPSEPLLS